MNDFLRDTFDETKRRFTDRDYLRWRMKRRLIRFGLVILTLILLAPVIYLLKLVNAPPAVAFAVTTVGVVFLIGLYLVLEAFGKPYEPPSAVVQLEPVPPPSAVLPPIAPQKTSISTAPHLAPPEPAPARTGGVLLALFGGCGIAVLLSCGGLFALAFFGTHLTKPAPIDAAPFNQPNVRFGNQPFDAKRAADEHRQRVEQMQREHQQRFEDMRKRHEELRNSSR